MALKNDTCDLYKTRYVKISSAETNILKYLEDKILCQKDTKMYERVSESGEIHKLYNLFKTYENNSPIYRRTKFSPTLIKTPSDKNINSELLSLNNIHKFDGPKTLCNICDNVHLIGFIDESQNVQVDEKSFRAKYVHLYDNPFSHETCLFYKNFF